MLKPPENKRYLIPLLHAVYFYPLAREVEILRLRLKVDIGSMDIELCPMPIPPWYWIESNINSVVWMSIALRFRILGSSPIQYPFGLCKRVKLEFPTPEPLLELLRLLPLRSSGHDPWAPLAAMTQWGSHAPRRKPPLLCLARRGEAHAGRLSSARPRTTRIPL